MQVSPEELREVMLEAVAEACWQAEYMRAAGKPRNVPWSEAGDEAHRKWRSIAAAAVPAAMGLAASWCKDNVMALGGRLDARRYDGYVVEASHETIHGGKHGGNGYAAALRIMGGVE